MRRNLLLFMKFVLMIALFNIVMTWFIREGMHAGQIQTMDEFWFVFLIFMIILCLAAIPVFYKVVIKGVQHEDN